MNHITVALGTDLFAFIAWTLTTSRIFFVYYFGWAKKAASADVVLFPTLQWPHTSLGFLLSINLSIKLEVLIGKDHTF